MTKARDQKPNAGANTSPAIASSANASPAAASAQTAASFRLVKQANGTWWFQLTWRGVTQPLSGPFRNQIEAASAAQQTARAFEAQRKR